MKKKKPHKEIVHKLNSLELEKLVGGFILGQLALEMGVFKGKTFAIDKGKTLKDGSWKAIVTISDE